VKVQVHTATFDELDVSTLYEVLRLRAEVFVVEQDCAFLDVDGRDRDPGTVHLWLEADGALVGYARLLPGRSATEIGRLVTAPTCRDAGLGTRVLTEAMNLVDGPVQVKAQARLAEWYERFGFEVIGHAFMEDGIPHVPMRLERGRRAEAPGPVAP
jgi:ElaA protein